MQVAQILGKNWQMLMISLGLTQPQIEQCELSSPNAPAQQIFSALRKWRTQFASEATVGRMVNSFQETTSVTVDREILKQIIQKMS